jgi:hypothetical protein
MIAILGLIILIAAVLMAVSGVTANLGDAHSLGGSFAVLGQDLNNLSTGQLFLFGIAVGAVGMLGLSMLLGTFNRRMTSRGARRELKGSQRETTTMRQDRDRLSRQLDDEHSQRRRTDSPETSSSVGPARAQPAPPPGPETAPSAEFQAPEVVQDKPVGLRERIAHYTHR